jgi:hypothetical protein
MRHLKLMETVHIGTSLTHTAYASHYFRDAYMILANAVPQLLSITNPLKIGDKNSGNVLVPSCTAATSSMCSWPKAEDFTKEQLQKIFWSRSTWTAHNKNTGGVTDTNTEPKKGIRGRGRAADGENVLMQYVVDKDGNAIDGFRAAEMRRVARSIWAQFSSAGLAPMKWMTETQLPTGEHYVREMQTRFPELRLCENGWKAHQIAIDYYPSWRTGQIKGGKAQLNKNEGGKAKTQDPAEDEVPETTSPKRKERVPEKRSSKRPRLDNVQKVADPL